ncbi:I78 family peptidase inhibitor [Ovoidimarina sediminis]|uniref:I78 family peptidase inhibitor n=1 Tax=Ovoidimarina sediminis TaxID=3079856 RepID=UPI00290B795E|nr:I78 family peptidase inhibitor [Rhodophyticola sp. MJ-SS7]MDU8944476.1 I78 family peptidase inhibitor [Rhodophyticola sp. MJ-SS7]
MRYLFLVIPMAACAASGPEPDACGASGLQHLVGQSESVFAAMTFPDTTRFIRPGMAVTMDYSEERLNFYLDETGVITEVRCG